MARRGNPYRDASGRFSSGPGGGGGGRSGLGAARKAGSPGARRKTAKPKVTGGTLVARTSLKKSRAKLNVNDTRQQEAAVLRGSRKLASAIKSSRKTGLSVNGVIKGKAAKQIKAQAGAARVKAGMAAEASAKKRGWGKEAQRDAFMRGVKKQRFEMLKRFLASGKKSAAKPKKAAIQQPKEAAKKTVAQKAAKGKGQAPRDAGPLRLMAGARRLQGIADKQKAKLDVFSRMAEKAPGRKYGKSTAESWRKAEKTGETLKKAAEFYARRIQETGKSPVVPPRRKELTKATEKRVSRVAKNVAAAKKKEPKKVAKTIKTSANALRWYDAARSSNPRPAKDSANNRRRFKRTSK